MERAVEFLRTLVRNKKALVGALMSLSVVLVAIFAPYIAPYDYDTMGEGSRFEPPSSEHLMGTDYFGRDVFSRVVYGSRVSLLIALVVAAAGAAIGLPMGVLAGYLGGWVDEIIMRAADVIFTFPWLLMALAVGAILGPGLTTVVISLSIVYSPRFARLMRGEVLRLREEEFVEASRSIGASDWTIVFRHIIPNATAVLLVQFTMRMAFAILAEAGISYLGFGTQAPMPSWGLMLGDGRDFMIHAPHISIFPGVAIMYTVLAFNFLGDGLRDILDPRMKGTGTL